MGLSVREAMKLVQRFYRWPPSGIIDTFPNPVLRVEALID
jgi:hypothetical protein